ncbi:MAG: hypothetical protein RIQ89_179 [Bacteroidota bacterium]|jgi:tetratricopeptide (TPR) repeat protein
MNHKAIEKRISILKSYIEEAPNDPFNYYALGLELVNLQQYESADTYFKFSHQVAPDYLPVYYQWAMCTYALGRVDEAIALAKQGADLAKQLMQSKTMNELNGLLANWEY